MVKEKHTPKKEILDKNPPEDLSSLVEEDIKKTVQKDTLEEEDQKDLEKEPQKEVKLLSSPHEEKKEELKAEKRLFDFIPDEVEEGVKWFEKRISSKTFFVSNFFILVFGIAFIVGLSFILNNNKLPFEKEDKISSYIPITRKPTSFNLDIKNPENDLWVFDSSIIISGKVSPKAHVIISNNDTDYALDANLKGEFSQIISLDTGINEITVSAFDDEGNTKQEKRTVFFSEEKMQ